MTRTIRIDGLSDAVHRELKARAARAGMSLPEFVLHELKRVAMTPADDMLAGRQRPQVEDPVAVVRAERDRR